MLLTVLVVNIDAMFLKGLQDGGVPIKFSSWHTYRFGTAGSANLNLQIQERSRSVKALFAIQRRDPPNMQTDSGAMFLCSTAGDTNQPNTLQSYQFRIGGRYFPAAPVQISTTTGSSYTNGGAEAYIELQKALNIVGDYRLSTGCNAIRWGIPPFDSPITFGNYTSIYSEYDYAPTVMGYDKDGSVSQTAVTKPLSSTGNCFSGNCGSQCFAMAIDLETSNGVEISGLNAEEQSDISLIATYAATQRQEFVMEVYAYYDAMIILRENNVLELIQ